MPGKSFSVPAQRTTQTYTHIKASERAEGRLPRRSTRSTKGQQRVNKVIKASERAEGRLPRSSSSSSKQQPKSALWSLSLTIKSWALGAPSQTTSHTHLHPSQPTTLPHTHTHTPTHPAVIQPLPNLCHTPCSKNLPPSDLGCVQYGEHTEKWLGCILVE